MHHRGETAQQFLLNVGMDVPFMNIFKSFKKYFHSLAFKPNSVLILTFRVFNTLVK